ncbi:UDP-4-amino-4,6-dideoxy-N-acetyl-beta-L-altrosamine transaminase [Cytobacillus firmus]|uniref:UDP-4-amino-4, 6-dideoxy-N-acetyl-beta-L-altrosamine transaminase n=1 Tax=Cytobacillus firmus TaxID=1399 RepID=UPI002162B286|nr:UDP-4-amino-4,6-dideoxy-N-acetyl-beta-L-altrosamine transaminase [Cytobacillus firmus]MCS0674061.1 UDP-4-amino-4,6-dideoxy-N-acetyl-beta-L-altrosamine transaminase [Cytobacillus firmus]
METHPVRNTYLPYACQTIDDEDIEAVVKVLKSNFLTTGPVIKEFEKKIADYVDAKYAVAFSSGTAALHGACFAAGIGPGDEVITSPMTFAASANCILYQKGKAVFADIDDRTYNISPKKIEQMITDKTRAIIAVDFTGQPANLAEIMYIAQKYNLVVIEDSAHALGASYKKHKVGSISDMTMFSFHPVKHITTGEGGMITTNSEDYYQKLLLFRSHGITRDPSLLIDNNGPWYYEMQYLGHNFRMTDIQAALGISQLQKLDDFLKIRKNLVSQYNNAFKDMETVQIPFQEKDRESSWHLYILRLNSNKLSGKRRKIVEALLEQNIGVNVHYIPVYLHPYYQKLGYDKGLCPIAEKLYEEIITLPLFPGMKEKDVMDVITAVKKVIKSFLV